MLLNSFWLRFWHSYNITLKQFQLHTLWEMRNKLLPRWMTEGWPINNQVQNLSIAFRGFCKKESTSYRRKDLRYRCSILALLGRSKERNWKKKTIKRAKNTSANVRFSPGGFLSGPGFRLHSSTTGCAVFFWSSVGKRWSLYSSIVHREIQTIFVLTCEKVGMWEWNSRKLSRREHYFVMRYSENGFFWIS